MLVLSRKEGERLVIGDNVTIIVTKVSGNRVTIGIEAPRDIRIMRGEVLDQSSDSASISTIPKMTIDLGELLDSSNATLLLHRQVG